MKYTSSHNCSRAFSQLARCGFSFESLESLLIRAFCPPEIRMQTVKQSLPHSTSNYMTLLEHCEFSKQTLAISTSTCVSSRFSIVDSSERLTYERFHRKVLAQQLIFGGNLSVA